MILFLLPKSPKFHVLLYVLLICYMSLQVMLKANHFMFGFLIYGTGIDSWVLFLIIHIPCMLWLLNILVKAKFSVISLFWSAVLILLINRNCLREHCDPVDQEALEGSTISHQVVCQAWCRVLGSTPPYTNPARVQPTHGLIHGPSKQKFWASTNTKHDFLFFHFF